MNDTPLTLKEFVTQYPGRLLLGLVVGAILAAGVLLLMYVGAAIAFYLYRGGW